MSNPPSSPAGDGGIGFIDPVDGTFGPQTVIPDGSGGNFGPLTAIGVFSVADILAGRVGVSVGLQTYDNGEIAWSGAISVEITGGTAISTCEDQDSVSVNLDDCSINKLNDNLKDNIALYCQV